MKRITQVIKAVVIIVAVTFSMSQASAKDTGREFFNDASSAEFGKLLMLVMHGLDNGVVTFAGGSNYLRTSRALNSLNIIKGCSIEKAQVFLYQDQWFVDFDFSPLCPSLLVRYNVNQLPGIQFYLPPGFQLDVPSLKKDN